MLAGLLALSFRKEGLVRVVAMVVVVAVMTVVCAVDVAMIMMRMRAGQGLFQPRSGRSKVLCRVFRALHFPDAPKQSASPAVNVAANVTRWDREISACDCQGQRDGRHTADRHTPDARRRCACSLPLAPCIPTPTFCGACGKPAQGRCLRWLRGRCAVEGRWRRRAGTLCRGGWGVRRRRAWPFTVRSRNGERSGAQKRCHTARDGVRGWLDECFGISHRRLLGNLDLRPVARVVSGTVRPGDAAGALQRRTGRYQGAVDPPAGDRCWSAG